MINDFGAAVLNSKSSDEAKRKFPFYDDFKLFKLRPKITRIPSNFSSTYSAPSFKREKSKSPKPSTSGLQRFAEKPGFVHFEIRTKKEYLRGRRVLLRLKAALFKYQINNL